MRKLHIIILLISFVQLLSAQGQSYTDSVNNAIVNLYSQLLVYPQEKAYVQTDRPYYISGEKIFFRAFLLQASTLKQSSFSRYVYIELISPLDTVVVRKQIRLDENMMFYGVLPLSESLPEGNYRIRCYTRYMENIGEPYLFTRSVYIANPNSSKVEIDSHFDISKQGEVAVELQLKDEKTKETLYPQEIVCRLDNGQQKTITKAELVNHTFKKFNLKNEDTKRMLLVEYKDGQNSFSKYIHIPYKEDKPDISFYPEGGNLIAGQNNRVAFNALMPAGNAIGIKGSVFNSRNELLITFETSHEGMGVFTLNVLAGESYHARCEYHNQVIEQKLPVVKTDTYSLTAFWEGDSLSVSVQKPETKTPSLCYLLVYRQGLPTYLKPWDFSKNKIKRGKDKFATGVTHLMLLTKDFVPISERMVFNNLHDAAKVEMLSHETRCKQREHVSLDIHLTDIPEDTVPASFAIAVTDDKDVKLDTTTNILSEVLLASELEGHINNPAWYFGSQKEAIDAADLLMLTHGWRRYNVTEAIQGKIQRPVIKPEVSQTFSGILKKITGKPYKNGKIKMSAVGYDFSEVAESDENGRYQFTDFEFPDSTSYFFLSYTNEKNSNVEICPDKINYPTLSIPWNNTSVIEDKLKTNDFTDYVSKADQKYRQDNGMRLIDLSEVSVTAHKKDAKPKPLNDFVAPGIKPDRFISSEQIKEVPLTTYEELFWRIAGVTNIDPSKGVTIRNEIAVILINGIEIDYKDIDACANIQEIAQVSVYTDLSVTAMYGMSKNGFLRKTSAVIALSTWPPGSQESTQKSTNTKIILPLGYQKPVEFYSPKYDTPEAVNNKPDLRSIIYWKPNQIVDNTHKASIDFYAADAVTSYSIVIEGVAPGRKLIYYKKNAFIKVNAK